MAFIITLTGASQCGKSTVVDVFKKAGNEHFKPYLIPKHVTRDIRDNDDEGVIGGGVPDTCDLVWELYGQRYGMHFDSIYECLDKGLCPIIIVNDIKIIQDIKTALGSQCISIFMYRQPPNLQRYIDEETRRFSKQLSPEVKQKIEETALTRFNKAQTIYRIYIENIYMFDHTILNVGDISDIQTQVEAIINKLTNSSKRLV